MNGHGPRRIVTVTTVAVAAMLLSLLALGGILDERRTQSEHDRFVLCQAENDSREAVREILLLARERAEPTPERQAFYDEALKLVPHIDCVNIGSERRETP